MSTIPFSSPTHTLTPAGAVQLLCERLPDRFRLAGPQLGEILRESNHRQTYTYRTLDIDTGPGWLHGGVHLQDGSPDIHEDESAPMALNAVASFCFDERVSMRLELNPENLRGRACTVIVGPDHRHGAAAAPTPAPAALLALAAYLQKRRFL